MKTIYPFRALTEEKRIVGWTGGFNNDVDVNRYSLKRSSGNFGEIKTQQYSDKSIVNEDVYYGALNTEHPCI